MSQDPISDGIAVIGLSCMFPGAPNVSAFWRNILGKVDAVTEPPEDGWDTDIYWDPSFSNRDKVYVRKGGYLGSYVKFDPRGHGIPPVSVGGEPDQWLALQLAQDALADAGCTDLSEEIRRRTAVVLGKGTYVNGGNAIAVQRALVLEQTLHLLQQVDPDIPQERIEQLRAELKAVLPPLGPEIVPGLIPNVIVGRIANRLDLMGPTYTVDAACASSLVAVQLAMRDLRSGACDLALAGGSQVWMPVPALNVFCQLGALSRQERIRPFDKNADGTLLGEGIGMVVLKRVQDAVRDGDRIYAVLRGIGVASDGRGVGVMAPRVEGEELALRRAYADADVDPRTVGLIEAHGTATPVGDVVEVQALTRVFGERAEGLPPTALGSVKSMISHTIPAAGIAGIIKTSLALYHRVLPPTLNVEEPNPKLQLERTPFYLNTETRPWITDGAQPRRAGVNAFGFGGINAHAVLEEFAEAEPSRHLPEWPDDVILLEAASVEELRERVTSLASSVRAALPAGDEPAPYRLVDLAYTLSRSIGSVADPLRLAIVASSLEDLVGKLDLAAGKLEKPGVRKIKHSSGIYFTAEPLARSGKVAFVFPGEGAQYPGMLADHCLNFPEVRAIFDRADRMHEGSSGTPRPSDLIFPRPTFSEQERLDLERQLFQMDSAVEAVLVANAAMVTLMELLDVRADVCVGHSCGEYSAALATGVLDVTRDERELTRFIRTMQECYTRAESLEGVPRAVLLAIAADRERVEGLLASDGGGARIALDNCRHQTVVVGTAQEITSLRTAAEASGLICETLDYDRAVHTPDFRPYAEALQPVFADLPFGAQQVPLWSSATCGPYPSGAEPVRQLFIDQWTMPVEWRRTVEKLYDEGVRVFIEVGPRGNLTAFVDDILRGKPSLAVAADVPRRRGTSSLNHLVGLLTVHGVSMNLDALYRRREPAIVDWTQPAEQRPDSRITLLKGWPAMTLDDAAIDRVRSAGAGTDAGADTDQPSIASTVSYETVPPVPPVPPMTPTPPVPPVPPATEVAGVEPISELVEFAPGDNEFPATDTVTGADAPELADLVARHFETMEHFLAVQEQVMQTYLTSTASGQTIPGAVAPATLSTGAAAQQQQAPYPLLGQVTVLQPGEELLAYRVFDPAEDLYLRDHTFGRNISALDPDAMALAVMPMTMSLEILAEAAACLLPALRVIGLSDIKAHRWLAWDGPAQRLEVTARRVARPASAANAQEYVAVQLRNLDEDPDGPSSPVVEATVLLDTTYPEPVAEAVPAPTNARPSAWTPEQLYSVGMFHGPSWQGVRSVDLTGSDGATATLQVLPVEGMFCHLPSPTYVLDPVVLDAAGQLIGFWTAETMEHGQVVFPFACDALHVYGPPRPVGEQLTCTARVTGLIGEQLMTSDIEVRDAAGRRWLRLDGWQDKRFDAPGMLRGLLGSAPVTLSSAWNEPAERLSTTPGAICRLLSLEVPSDKPFWVRVWAARVLSPREYADFTSRSLPPARQLEWLAARTAAKEAVQQLLAEQAGLAVQPADVEITSDTEGRPVVDGPWRAVLGVPAEAVPVVSLCHTQGYALALAAWPALAGTAGPAGSAGPVGTVGIDVEVVTGRPAGFAAMAFAPDEQSLLDTCPAEAVEEWTLRAWCAKEAVAKALGTGLLGDPRTVGIVGIDTSTGRIAVEIRGALAERLGAAYEPLGVNTLRAGPLVVGTTDCAPVTHDLVRDLSPAEPSGLSRAMKGVRE